MCASSVVTPQAFHTEPAPLAQGLPEFQRQLAKTLPPDAHARLAAAIDGMFATKPGAAALKVGQPAPDFVLPSLDGGTVALANELLAGPVVLTFYRGSWCPYCDLQLRAYAKLVPLLRSASARLLAVSPQAAEAAVPNASDHRGLGFPAAHRRRRQCRPSLWAGVCTRRRNALSTAVVEAGRRYRASTMSIALLAAPSLGIVISAAVLGEAVGLSLVAGVLLTGAGIGLVGLRTASQ